MTATTTPELLTVDPATLEIGDNVRDEVDLDATPEFVESIAEHGVLHPILAERRNDGTILVTDGQRRLLAARVANRTSVPVIIRPQGNGTDNARKAARIGQQIVSNDQREALTDGQRAAGIAAMLDLGLSQTAVAKAASVSRDRVKTLATVGASKAARASVDEHQFTIEQAATIAEFEEAGDTEGINRLLSYGSHYQFDYMAERLRRDRAERIAHAEAAAPYEAKGFTILDGYNYHPVTFEHVLTETGEPITLETVEADASRWGVRLSWTEAWFDRQSGAEVAEDEIDWDTHENPDLEAEDGLIHMNNIETRRVWDREFHLLDPGNLEGSGLQLSDVAKVMVARRTGRAAAVPATAEEAAAQIEAEREERRRVRELNKRAEAANTVRRTFLRTLLGRTKLPANASVWIAVTLASDPHLLAEYHASDCFGELLGIKDYRLSNNAVRDLAVAASDARAQVITFALVIAAMEARMVKDAWRTRPRGATAYLELLAANGYELSDVEKAIAAHIKPETISLD